MDVDDSANFRRVATLPEYDLFDLPSIQGSVERDILSIHRPLTTLDSKSIIEYVIPTAEDEFIQLRDTLFYLRFVVTLKKANGTNGDDTDYAALGHTNNLLHSMFKQIDMEINGKKLTVASQTYPYLAFLQTLTGFTTDAEKSYLSSSGWVDNDNSESIVTNARKTLLEDKTELVGTVTHSTSPRVVELMGKLHFDMAMQGRALLGGATLKITLIPNEPAFYIKYALNIGCTPHVEFTSALLYIRRSKVSPALLEGLHVALADKTARYPIVRHEIKSYVVPSNTFNAYIPNIINGKLPRRALVAMVDNSAFSGHLREHPFNFKHNNATFIAMNINGIQYPNVAYEPDYSEKKYLREYMGLFEAYNQLTTDATINVTRYQYPKGYNIYAFNFTPDGSEGALKTGYTNPISEGNMSLTIRFKSQLQKTINIIVFMEFDSLVQIDKNLNAFTDFV